MNQTHQVILTDLARYSKLTILVLLLSSCSMLSVKKDQVAAIEKVAVVAFSVQHEMPQGATISVGNTAGDSPMMGVPSVVRMADFVDSMYMNLNDHLKNEMKWQVLTREQVAQNERYQSVHKAQTGGWQNRPISSEGVETFASSGILDDWSFQRLNERERDELMQHLGVDAIAAVEVKVALERGGGLKKLVGAVEYSPRATLVFRLFKKGQKDPVWSDYQAAGAASDQAVQAVLGHAPEAKIFGETVLAANKAYNELSRRYEQGE